MARKRNPNRKIRYPRRKGAPYLLPNCPIQYCQGLYEGEGSHFCLANHPTKEATPSTAIEMKNLEALNPCTPCFGLPPRKITRPTGITYRLQRFRAESIEIAKALATTRERKQQITDAQKRCQQLKQQGYRIRL